MANPPVTQARGRLYHAPYDRPDIGADFLTLSYAHEFAMQHGQPQQLYDLYLLLNRRETASAAATNSRVDAVTARPLEVISGGDSDEDRQAAQLFSEVWSDIDQSVVGHLAFSANTFGVGAAEIDWVFDREMDIFRPTGLHAVLSRALGWTVANPYSYEIRRINGTVGLELPNNTWLLRVGAWEWETLRPDKWIVVSPHAPASPADRGLSYGCSFLALLILAGRAGWTAFVDRYGLPMLHVVINDWTNKRAADSARSIIQNWGTDKGVLTAQNDGISFTTIDGAQNSRVSSSDVHQRFVADARAEIQKVWTSGTLIQDTATNGGSPRALGQVHEGGFLRAVESDIKLIIRSLEQQLVRPWMRFNDIQAKAPKFRAQTASVDSPMHAAALAQMLGTAGYDIDTDELSKTVGFTVSRRETN